MQRAEGDLRPLGVVLESTVDPERPQTLHHKVAHMLPEGEGLARDHRVLRVGDDVLQVNRHVLVGLSHSEAVDIVQDMPPSLTVVVSRPLGGGGVGKGEGTGTLEEGSDAVDSEASPLAETDENHAPSGPAPQRPLPANIDFLLDDFSRRFERQSWRIRHEEERRRLKQKFEVSSPPCMCPRMQ